MELKKFLKKFSDVPNGFIDDFFNIAKETYGDLEFVINFEKVVKWLKTRKDSLKRLLVRKFEENYDYTVDKVKVKNKNRGSNYHDIIYLTPDCFKQLCMLSETKKGKDVRRYYLSLEKLVRRYYRKIQEDIYKELGLLRRNQKPKINKKKGVVYILKALNTSANVYKIGRTKNIRNRLKNYNSGLANDVEPLFILEVDDVETVEECIKMVAKEYKYRKYKETYQIDLNVLKQIFTRCDDFLDGFKKLYNRNKTESKKVKKNIKRLKNEEGDLFAFVDKK